MSLDGTQFRCVVNNSAGTAVSSAATLTVLDPPVVTSAASATFIVGQPNTFNVAATGSPAVSYAVNGGSFPAWASLNATTGVISGNPPDASGSPFTFNLRVGNSYQSAFQNFTLTVQSAAPPPGHHARSRVGCARRRGQRHLHCGRLRHTVPHASLAPPPAPSRCRACRPP